METWGLLLDVESIRTCIFVAYNYYYSTTICSVKVIGQSQRSNQKKQWFTIQIINNSCLNLKYTAFVLEVKQELLQIRRKY